MTDLKTMNICETKHGSRYYMKDKHGLLNPMFGCLKVRSDSHQSDDVVSGGWMLKLVGK